MHLKGVRLHPCELAEARQDHQHIALNALTVRGAAAAGHAVDPAPFLHRDPPSSLRPQRDLAGLRAVSLLKMRADRTSKFGRIGRLDLPVTVKEPDADMGVFFGPHTWEAGANRYQLL